MFERSGPAAVFAMIRSVFFAVAAALSLGACAPRAATQPRTADAPEPPSGVQPLSEERPDAPSGQPSAVLQGAGHEPRAEASSDGASGQSDIPHGEDSEHTDPDDDIEEDDEQAATPSRRAAAPHPLDGVSDAEIFRRLKEDPSALGSMSIGLPNGGLLINGVQMPADPRWTLVDPSHIYGTRETVDYLVRALGVAAAAAPDTPPYFIGHLSGPRGGHLRPHRSHQSGRDVDIGFVYVGGGRWYQRATQATLDLPRTWALVRALIVETDPQFILIDHSIQRWLYDFALAQGEDRAWLDDLFKGTAGVRPALIRHAKGHATHLHVRFWNPVAEQTARRSYSSLVRLQRISPPTHFVNHRAKKGETLIHLAKRYGTTVRAIKQANRLRSNLIMAKKTYRIPQKGVSPMGPRTVPPERRLPPDRRASPERAPSTPVTTSPTSRQPLGSG
jgi:LysM repeat protein/murein endopeptidase